MPQSTICGPKFFLVYINDLTTTVSMCKYVDDSTIFEICEFGGMPVIQESVDITTMWTIRNEMIINSEKNERNGNLLCAWR